MHQSGLLRTRDRLTFQEVHSSGLSRYCLSIVALFVSLWSTGPANAGEPITDQAYMYVVRECRWESDDRWWCAAGPADRDLSSHHYTSLEECQQHKAPVTTETDRLSDGRLKSWQECWKFPVWGPAETSPEARDERR